jgi:hypothetical protein
MLMAISSGEISSVMLIVGALVALAIAVFGRKGLKEGKKDTEFNKKLRIVSGIAGVAMIGWAFLMIYEDTWTQFLMLLMFILLGIGLMLPVLPKTNLGTIIALLVAAFVGYTTYEYVDINIWIAIIVTLVVFFALFLIFRVIAASTTLIGSTVGSRWVLLVLGFTSIAIAVWAW